MSHHTEIIKRGGQRPNEQFMRHKLHSSIFAACLSLRTPEGQATAIAGMVCDEVVKWLEQRPEVTSHDIRCKAAKVLEKHHPDAAYLYKQNQITI